MTPVRSLDDPTLWGLLSSLQAQTCQDFEHLLVTEGSAEEARAIGIRQAQGSLICLLDADNVLRSITWLATMCQYAQRPGCLGAYTARYDWVADDTALSRYFALLGANDPLCWWLGQADRLDYRQPAPRTRLRQFPRGTRLPSLGCNGFLLKGEIARRHLPDPATYAHVDWLVDIHRAEGQFACWVVSEQTVWHRSGESWWGYLRRRSRYVSQLYFQRRSHRRWHMVQGPHDTLRVIGFALASLVVLPHCWVAFQGWRRQRDWAWYLHPLVCLLLTGVYGLAWLTSRWPRLWSPRISARTPSGPA